MKQHGPIPAPPNFPVVWENPDDERLFWTRDAMHFPNPVNALEEEFLVRIAQGKGFARACEAYDMPIRLRARRINTFLYSASVPVVSSPEEMEAMGEHSQKKLREAMVRLGERWRGEYLKDWDRFRLRTASMLALLAHLDETVARFSRLWEIHFTVAFPMGLSMSMFEEFYRELFDSDGAFTPTACCKG